MRRAGTFFSALAAASATLGLGSTALAYDELAHACPTDKLQCETALVKFDKTDALPIQWQLDTGWTPAGSPVQVRITAGVWAQTHVALAGWFVTSWPKAMTLEANGKPDGGLFDFHYGAEFSAQGMIDISVLGQNITWQGDLPYLPEFDLEVKAHQQFDAWGFAPGITISSTTQPQEIAKVSLADLLGGQIPGIDGGFELSVAMELQATYVTNEIALSDEDGKPVDGGPISLMQTKSSEPYLGGPHIDYQIQPKGTVSYEGIAHLIPSFYVSFLGQMFTIPVVDVPIPFSLGDTDWIFDPNVVRVPVPDLYLDEREIDFGEVDVGDSLTKSFHAWNAGEALLHADVSSGKEEFTVAKASLELDPDATHVGKVTFSPTKAGSFEAHLDFASNDPSNPVEHIVLMGVGKGIVTTMDPPPKTGGDGLTGDPANEDSGCGCRTVGTDSSSAPAFGLGFAFVALCAARRRRRRGVRLG